MAYSSSFMFVELSHHLIERQCEGQSGTRTLGELRVVEQADDCSLGVDGLSEIGTQEIEKPGQTCLARLI